MVSASGFRADAPLPSELFLNDDQVEKLHDFEEDCMDDLAREKELRKRTSNEERILRTAER